MRARGATIRPSKRPSAIGVAKATGRGLVLALTVALAGCTTSQSRGPTASALPAAPPNIVVASTDLVGDWGLASYRVETDRPRTEAEAKVACGNPYRIGPGSGGGVMMHLADQTETTEVFVKAAPTGQVFIGPQGPPGVAQDRLVVAYDNNSVLVTDWLDQSARERYGTMIFVRCGAA
jgi:hypothetical protein